MKNYNTIKSNKTQVGHFSKTQTNQYMKTTLTLLILLFFCACQHNEFETDIQYLGTDAIKYVRLYSNSPVLIADGKSSLTFKVKAFTEIERTITDKEGNIKQRIDTLEIINDRLPQNEITITTKSGETINDFCYKTDQILSGVQEFTATIGSIKSLPIQVKLINKHEKFTPITIPVIFHIISNNNTKEICTGITQKYLEEKLTHLNQAFSGDASNSPTATDTGIRFILATHTPEGKILKEAGIRREDRKNEKTADIKKHIINKLMWDPSKYLNIWIYDASAWDEASKAPKYILNNGTEIEGLKLEKVTAISDVTAKNPEDIGITLIASSFFKTKWESIFGTFFGLLPTYLDSDDKEEALKGKDSDYCVDTYSYERMYAAIEKWTFAKNILERIYYDSYNIMDEYTAGNTITPNQAVRIRQTTENCPFRMMRQQ